MFTRGVKYTFIVLEFFILFSCQNTSESSIYYTVSRTDYENKINVTGYLEAENSSHIACPRLFTSSKILFIVPEGTFVFPGDTVCILEASEIDSRYSNALNELEIARKEYNKTIENLALETLLLESQVNTIEASTQISKLNSVQTEFSSESNRRIIELEIQIAEIEKEKIKNKLRFLKQINDSELAKQKLIIEQKQNDVNRAKDALDKLTITTNREGIALLSTHYSTGELLSEGDAVWDGRSLLNIPDLSSLQAKLVVSESDFKRILPKQVVAIDVDALPDVSMTGEIFRKSGGGKEIQRGSPIKKYEIIVKLDSMPASLKPGLSLSCEVFIEKITDTIAVPLICVFDRDSTKVVYIKNKNKFIERRVYVAGNSSTMALISEGLNEREEISTYKPSSNKIQ